jgi:hypothetical protein
MIFCFVPPDTSSDKDAVVKPRELWITYPIISLCTFRAASPLSRHPSSIRLRCRDFTFVCFYFFNEANARAAYDSIRSWTCRIGRIEKLYAFVYQPPPPERKLDGWKLYDARQEWARLGVEKDTKSGWRISTINQDYSVCALRPLE